MRTAGWVTKKPSGDLGEKVEPPAMLIEANPAPYRSVPPFGHWVDWITFWRKRIASAPELAANLVEFFQLSFEWLPPRTFAHAWFGKHSSVISSLVGNMWLVAALPTNGGRVWLLTDDPHLPADTVHLIPSTRRYLPLWSHTYSWERIVEVNNSALLWQSYARAAEKIWASPIARNEISIVVQNKHRLPALLGQSESDDL